MKNSKLYEIISSKPAEENWNLQPGSEIGKVLDKAIQRAKRTKAIIKFNFNGRNLKVTKESKKNLIMKSLFK